MKEYEFTLKYLLPNSNTDPDKHVEALMNAGCDDALIGLGQQGRIALEFIRESVSAVDAITSALTQVKEAIPGAQLVEATPDFVGLTDVAEIIGCSRQNMRNLVRTHTHTFPSPIHEGKAAIWNLFPVLNWLLERNTYLIDAVLIEVAKTTMEVNIAKQTVNLSTRIKHFQKLIS